MNRIALCLLLLCASSLANARDVRLHGPNGDGGSCPEATAVATAAPAASKHAPVVNRGKARAPTAFRGGGDDTVTRTPRWHSFLPGMFR